MSSAGPPILASTDRLMTSPAVRSSVRSVKPVTVDRILAPALLVIAELEVWLTQDAGGHRLLAAIVAPIVTGCLALRRRYPFAAGIAAQTATLAQFIVTRDVQIIATSIAW